MADRDEEKTVPVEAPNEFTLVDIEMHDAEVPDVKEPVPDVKEPNRAKLPECAELPCAELPCAKLRKISKIMKCIALIYFVLSAMISYIADVDDMVRIILVSFGCLLSVVSMCIWIRLKYQENNRPEMRG